MLRILLLVLIVIPIMEIWGLVTVGGWIGPFWTILLVILTGVLGAYLAKKEGTQALKRAKEQLAYGLPPGEAILDGICIFAGGLVLLTPGFFTDAMGFLLLWPRTRKYAKNWMKEWIRKWLDKGSFTIHYRP
ncbi:membrane protein FxsA [Microaerobacter geothermalis]|uniref:FxsA family protein n=1 Tax=Microaerobacter geothermalis TaxID=674972 RepID=UPI001F360F19|nr:FxsA family protein [Microaerobacter geothermalis]MCF6092949.1 membrane protein FxsA [Microaerobacter geothermalis]